MATQDLDNTLVSRKTSTIINVVDHADGTGLLCGDTFRLCTLPAGAAIVNVQVYTTQACVGQGADDVEFYIGVSGALSSIYSTTTDSLATTGTPAAEVLGADYLEVISDTAGTEILGSFVNSTDAGVEALTAGTVRVAITIGEYMNG